MKYPVPVPRRDKEREKQTTSYGEVKTYIASKELAEELTKRMEKKHAELLAETDRSYSLTGSKGRRR